MDNQTDPNNSSLPENLQAILLDLVQKYERENDWVRKRQIMRWKKNDRFWHGIQFIFWSETNQDWMAPVETSFSGGDANGENNEGPFYDYVINIYKAHGEAIIAALSAQIPAVRFPPDDPDSVEDQETAKTFDKVADLIQRHNQAKRVMLQALLMLWNQGIVAAYHAPKFDKAFGNIQIPQYKSGKQCVECGYVADMTPTGGEVDEQGSEGSSASLLNGGDIGDIGDVCPQCGQMMQDAPILDGFKDSPKMRVLIDIYGPLHVKIPYYARTQKDCGYLICALDQPLGFLKSIYCRNADGSWNEELAQKIDAGGREDMGNYERIARSPSAYAYNLDGDQYLGTLKRVWLRPWVFDDIPESQAAEREELRQMFPDGCYVGTIGRVYVESRNESLDKYWTIGQGGLSQYIHSDPIGSPLVPIQELRNIAVNLTEETIEQGIPSGFADTDTLNFEVYSKHEARPGTIYPVKRKAGENLANSFYETSRATLSKEVPLFIDQLDKDGQFVVGSFPSIYGGPGEGNSRTASEYNMSRQMALQRLSIIWSLLNFWWCKLIEKCVHLYVENMIEDERFVTKTKGNYVNVWIKRASLTGVVGEVEPEGDESFPITLAQKQSIIQNLMQLQLPEINEALFSVPNRKILSEVFSLTELKMPGEDQRIKQEREIEQMIATKQFIVPEQDIDDNLIHAEVVRNYLVSDIGMDLKQTDPESYDMLFNHLKLHIQFQMMSQMNQAPQEQPQEQGNENV